MRKNVFIGITASGKACILSSIATFDSLVKNANDVEASDFVHSSTNWGGKDSLERTLSLEHLSLTGRELSLPRPIVFTGSDYDSGHNYDWQCNVVKIAETAVEL